MVQRGAKGNQSKVKVAVVLLRKAEKAAILAAVTQSDWHVSLAAAKLEIGKTTLYRKLKEYGFRLKKRRRLAAIAKNLEEHSIIVPSGGG